MLVTILIKGSYSYISNICKTEPGTDNCKTEPASICHILLLNHQKSLKKFQDKCSTKGINCTRNQRRSPLKLCKQTAPLLTSFAFYHFIDGGLGHIAEIFHSKPLVELCKDRMQSQAVWHQIVLSLGNTPFQGDQRFICELLALCGLLSLFWFLSCF